MYGNKVTHTNLLCFKIKKELNMNYGKFGGQYVPQELKEKLNEIEREFEKAINDEEFKNEYLYYLKQYIGRPSPLYYAENLFKSYWFTQNK